MRENVSDGTRGSLRVIRVCRHQIFFSYKLNCVTMSDVIARTIEHQMYSTDQRCTHSLPFSWIRSHSHSRLWKFLDYQSINQHLLTSRSTIIASMNKNIMW